MKREISEERRGLLRSDDRAGISAADAVQLTARFGENRIAEYRARSIGEIAGDTARDPMLWFLAVTSAVFALLGEFTDTIVLLVAIIPLMGMDFYLHRRTEASVRELGSALATHACVIREGRDQWVAAGALVPGDLVRVSSGGPFPADGVILAGESLQAEESSLTGEAYPVRKLPLRGGPDEIVEENWAFAGTRLLTGDALVRILFTGSDSLYGGIVRAATATRHEHTRLQDDVARLVRLLLWIATAICLLLAGVRLWQGHGLVDAFLSAAVLAVAAIPEEFPVVLTFSLGLGVYRLAQSRALVRRALAVENIGRVSVICSDKTGTITEGKLRLHELRPAPGTDEQGLIQWAAMASRRGSHDALDESLLAAARPLGPEKSLLATYPFTESRRREVSVWQFPESRVAVIKGAPETVLTLCDLEAAERAAFLEDAAAMSVTGQKVIGCAYRGIESVEEPKSGYRFAGLVGVADPLRDRVRESVRLATAAGIQIVMMTGDHPRTAEAIAREAGLSTDPVILSGDEVEARLREGERAFLGDLDVVARATPGQKVMLVEAMREGGRVTAVTGDGVNDVPALKAADVGIAMGLRGNQSAREVAAIVLMDDNFGTIVRAIAEGRQLFQNLTRSFAFLLMIHIPLVTTAALIPLFGYPLLYLPIHIVVLELLIHPSAILGFQQAAPSGLEGVARQTEGFFSRRQLISIGVVGLLVTLGLAGLFIGAEASGESPERARAMAVTALIVSLVTLLATLSRLRGRAPCTIAAGGLTLAAVATSLPALANMLHLHPLTARDWLISAAVGVFVAAPALLFNRTPFPGPAKSDR